MSHHCFHDTVALVSISSHMGTVGPAPATEIAYSLFVSMFPGDARSDARGRGYFPIARPNPLAIPLLGPITGDKSCMAGRSAAHNGAPRCIGYPPRLFLDSPNKRLEKALICFTSTEAQPCSRLIIQFPRQGRAKLSILGVDVLIDKGLLDSQSRGVM